MKKKYILKLLVTASILFVGVFSMTLFLSTVASDNKVNQIVLDCKVVQKKVNSMSGFLHTSADTLEIGKAIESFHPTYWRIGWTLSEPEQRRQVVKFLKRKGVKPILVVSDFYHYPRDYKAVSQWKSPIDNQEKFISLIRDLYLEEHNDVIYDIWNEPDHTHYWNGTNQSFFKVFKLAHDVLRSLPGGDSTEITGPSISQFDVKYMNDFIEYSAANNIKLNVLNWHDFRAVNEIGNIKNDLLYAQDNWQNKFPGLKIDKIIIPEILGLNEQYSSLAALAYFSTLEKGNAFGACKACWNNSSGQSNCTNNSLDGLYTETGAKRAIWWVYHLYSESTFNRIKASTSNDALSVFASFSGNEIHILMASSDKESGADCVQINYLKSYIGKNYKKWILEVYLIPESGEEQLDKPILLYRDSFKRNKDGSLRFELRKKNKEGVCFIRLRQKKLNYKAKKNDKFL